MGADLQMLLKYALRLDFYMITPKYNYLMSKFLVHNLLHILKLIFNCIINLSL